MKNNLLVAALLTVTSFSLTSCDAIFGILEAGMWIGAIIVIAIIALVLWLIRKIRR